jgi:hypothetical protein
MEALIAVVILGVVFLGYDLWRIAESTDAVLAQLQEIRQELKPTSQHASAYEILKALGNIEQALINRN